MTAQMLVSALLAVPALTWPGLPALRDTSAILAAIIAVVFLKEPLERRVMFAVVLATAGSMLIRAG